MLGALRERERRYPKNWTNTTVSTWQESHHWASRTVPGVVINVVYYCPYPGFWFYCHISPFTPRFCPSLSCLSPRASVPAFPVYCTWCGCRRRLILSLSRLLSLLSWSLLSPLASVPASTVYCTWCGWRQRLLLSLSP